jgi:hypothetical protein
MSQRNGDRSLFNRKRKAKIARRTRWSALTSKPAETKAAEPSPKTAAAKS